MAGEHILIVEDEADIAELLQYNLERQEYDPEWVASGEEGLIRAREAEPALVVLDLMLPGLSGIEVCRRLKAEPATAAIPVIMLTAKGEETDRVKGLKLGSDDYVVKPFGIKELLARIEAVLRRSAERPRVLAKLSIAGRIVDFERREARLPDGSVVQLPQREADVLAYLAANPGRAVSRDELLSRVWGFDPRGVHTRTVDMAVARLREQLGDDPGEPTVIATVRGRGYMLAQAVPVEADG